MAVAWPAYLPIGLRAGHSVQIAEVVDRTEMEAGPVRLRQIAPPGPETIPISWVMSSATQQQFRKFWQRELASGAALVDMPIRTDGTEVTVQTVNFMGAPLYTLEGPLRWKVTATLQTRSPLVIDDALFDFVAGNGGADEFLAIAQGVYHVTNYSHL